MEEEAYLKETGRFWNIQVLCSHKNKTNFVPYLKAYTRELKKFQQVLMLGLVKYSVHNMLQSQFKYLCLPCLFKYCTYWLQQSVAVRVELSVAN